MGVSGCPCITFAFPRQAPAIAAPLWAAPQTSKLNDRGGCGTGFLCSWNTSVDGGRDLGDWEQSSQTSASLPLLHPRPVYACKMSIARYQADDGEHVAKFTHLYPDLPVKPSYLEKLCPQPFDYFLVLDLEGRVEILEFPVVLLDAQTLAVVDRFHRFVRPVKMSEQRITEYIEGKYGRWGLDRVWHDTAVPFTQVIENFEEWLKSHGLWNPTKRGKMRRAAFVTCGNWDVKTKIPEQCVSSEITVPPYFHEWINLKDIYLNFYNQRAGGMLAMLKGLKMHVQGSHHLGLDDAHNIARVLQRVLADGAVVKITAKRSATDPKDVKFTFRNRVK